jgi:uncharacterized iron-regulated membrane protein
MITVRSLRLSVFRLHAWIGLHVCLFFAFLFLTGTILVAGGEIEALFDARQRPAVTADRTSPEGLASPGQILTSVRAAFPDTDIFLTQRDERDWIGDRTLIRTRWGEQALVWTDPTSAEVIGVTPYQGFKKTLRELHSQFLVPKGIFTVLVTSSSVLLLASIITGLITYRRFWKGYFRLPSRAAGDRTWWGGLHRLLAVWSLPFLAIVALTSLYYFVAGIGIWHGRLPPVPAPSEREAMLPAEFDGPALDAAVAEAAARIPGFRLMEVQFPLARSDAVVLKGAATAALVRPRANSLAVDPATGAVLASWRAEDLGTADRAAEAVDRLHFGTWGGTNAWGGVISRALWIVFGLAATLIALSGAAIFAARTRPVAAVAAGLDARGAGAARAGGGLRRFWRGMGVLRFVYPLLFLAFVPIIVWRSEVLSPKWVTVAPPPGQAVAATLRTQGVLRPGGEIAIRVDLADKDARPEGTARLAGGPEVPLVPDGPGRATAVLPIPEKIGPNPVVLTLTQPAVQEPLTWRLGRPLRPEPGTSGTGYETAAGGSE